MSVSDEDCSRKASCVAMAAVFLSDHQDKMRNDCKGSNIHYSYQQKQSFGLAYSFSPSETRIARGRLRRNDEFLFSVGSRRNEEFYRGSRIQFLLHW